MGDVLVSCCVSWKRGKLWAPAPLFPVTISYECGSDEAPENPGVQNPSTVHSPCGWSPMSGLCPHSGGSSRPCSALVAHGLSQTDRILPVNQIIFVLKGWSCPGGRLE